MRTHVFVSSRFEEFKELRAGLRDAFQADEMFEAQMLDDGSAAPTTPTDRSLGAVDEADVFVLLLGRSYRQEQGDDVSIVHREFREAMERRVPVYAYAIQQDDTWDPRAVDLADDVRSHYTVGVITEDLPEVIDRILADLEGFLADAADDDQGASSVADMLRRDLAFLGADAREGSTATGTLAAFRLSDQDSRSEPAYNQLIEQRRFALLAIRDGDLRGAREHLDRARDIYSRDWATNYLSARLVESTRRRGDLALGIELAGTAKLTADDLAHAPAVGLDDSTAIQRRRVASMVLEGRLCRLRGDVSRRSLLEEALEQMPHSRPTQIELVLQHVGAGDRDAADVAWRRLTAMYPDAAARLARSSEYRSIDDGSVVAAQQLVTERKERFCGELRRHDVPPNPSTLDGALRQYRSLVDDARQALAGRTEQLVDLLWVERLSELSNGVVHDSPEIRPRDSSWLWQQPGEVDPQQLTAWVEQLSTTHTLAAERWRSVAAASGVATSTPPATEPPAATPPALPPEGAVGPPPCGRTPWMTGCPYGTRQRETTAAAAPQVLG